MIDVDARGRHEAELLHEEAARIADTAMALKSVLDDDILVPIVMQRDRAPRRVVARGPASVRRRIPILVGVAAAVVALIAFVPGSGHKGITPADTVVISSTELVVQPLDPPIECELDRCPSLAVSPEGTLVAYDQAAKTLTWYDAETHVVPVSADLDAEHVQLEAIGPGDFAYLLAGSPDTQSWELVMIDQSGAEVRRIGGVDPDIEPDASGLRERFCWNGCVPVGHLVMYWEGPLRTEYPVISQTTGTVEVVFGDLRWAIAWPYTLGARSTVVPRRDGGAVVSLVPESGDAPSELIELLPDGSLQRFGLGDETVHALAPDGSAIVWRDGGFVALLPPQPPPEWPAALAPDLTAQALEPPMICDRVPTIECPSVTVSPDGTLVAWDSRAETLTWYEDEPRVVPVEADLPLGDVAQLFLIAIGPHDIAYLVSLDPPGYLVAIAPSGAEITRRDWPNQGSSSHPGGPVSPTATGLVGMQDPSAEWPPPNAVLAMPWVDLDGNPITDNRPFPTAKATDAEIEVRLGARRWLLPQETTPPRGAPPIFFYFPRSDGGVAMLIFGATLQLLELSPDGTIERYDIGELPLAILPSAVQSDGSLIAIHDLQLVRLTPRA
jgi:hypothetical protein